MPSGNRPTEDEHFVPQMYLKGFSEIKKKRKTKKEVNYIWQFDVKTMQQTPDQVNTGSVCFEKDLYEFRDRDGSIFDRNIIENKFGKLENKTRRVIGQIISKSQDEKCLYCTNILSEEDRSYLIIFMTALMYRDPKTIEMGISTLQNTAPNMDRKEARNITLRNLRPLNIDPQWDNNTIIGSAVENFCGMAFQIGFTDDDVIITCDRPVIIYPSHDKTDKRPRAVVFPLPSKLVLYLYPIENVYPCARCCFSKMSKQQIEDIQTNIVVYARRWIYSRNMLTDEQLEIIKRARTRMPKIPED